jgi:hypothetical protein
MASLASFENGATAQACCADRALAAATVSPAFRLDLVARTSARRRRAAAGPRYQRPGTKRLRTRSV